MDKTDRNSFSFGFPQLLTFSECESRQAVQIGGGSQISGVIFKQSEEDGRVLLHFLKKFLCNQQRGLVPVPN